MKSLSRLLLAAISATFFIASAQAQNAGTVTQHAFAIGKGAGVGGYTSLLCGSAQLAVGQSAADPVCQTITGDVTISAGGVTAIGAGKVVNADLGADVFSTAHSWSGAQTLAAPIFTGVVNNQGAHKDSTQSTPAQITADQNDYNPLSAVCSTTTTLIINSDIARNITGIAGGVSGCDLFLFNNGGFTITLKDGSASSAAANRFAFGADFTLAAKAAVHLKYDGNGSVWRNTTGSAGTGGGVTSVTCGVGLSGGSITTTGTCDNYLEPGAITDCIIVPSVSGNALTVALKNRAGADPSASAPCWVSFRNATAATGDYTVVAVTAATSFSTGTSGSTFGSSNNVPFRLWVELWNNSGTVAIGVSLHTTASTTFPLNEGAVASTTACNACTNATSAGTFYTAAALTSKAFRVFGYMDWGSGLTTAGTYASGPTLVVLKTISVLLPGTPVQMASGSQSSASQTSTTSASYVSTSTTATLSPTSSVDPVVCSFYGTIQLTTGNTVGTVSILRGGTLVGFGLFPFTGSGGQTNWPAANTVRDLPGTTSSTTYTVSIKSDGTHTMAFPAGSGDSGAGISCSEISG